MSFIFVHWGEEYQQKPSVRQQEKAQFLFQNGIDLIIGSHPHVIQPIEYFAYNPEDTTQRKLVYWSLGNFISNQREKNTDGGILASFTLAKNKSTQQTQIESNTYIPYWVYRNLSMKPGYYILPTYHPLIDSITMTFSKVDLVSYQLFVNSTDKLLKK